MEICPEAPGGEIASKSRWGKDEKRGGFFFSFLCGKQKGGGGQLTFYSIFSGGKSVLTAMIFPDLISCKRIYDKYLDV